MNKAFDDKTVGSMTREARTCVGGEHLWDGIPRWGDTCLCGKKKLELFRERDAKLDDKFVNLKEHIPYKSYRLVFKEVDT